MLTGAEKKLLQHWRDSRWTQQLPNRSRGYRSVRRTIRPSLPPTCSMHRMFFFRHGLSSSVVACGAWQFVPKITPLERLFVTPGGDNNSYTGMNVLKPLKQRSRVNHIHAKCEPDEASGPRICRDLVNR